MTVRLPSHIEKFIQDRVRAGEYASAQEVVCAALRLLKSRAAPDINDDFQPGEWDKLLEEADDGDAMTLDQAITRRRTDRAKAKARR